MDDNRPAASKADAAETCHEDVLCASRESRTADHLDRFGSSIARCVKVEQVIWRADSLYSLSSHVLIVVLVEVVLAVTLISGLGGAVCRCTRVWLP